MKHNFNISDSNQVDAWIIQTDNCEVDVCNIANTFNLDIFINLNAPLGLYRESESKIFLQNKNLDFFSFWIFLHELGHHKNTLYPQSHKIQSLYSLKIKENLMQKIEFLNNIFEVLRVCKQKVFGSYLLSWETLSNSYQTKLNELESISNLFFGFSHMPHQQFIKISNELRLEIKNLTDQLEIIYHESNLENYFYLALGISELLAWSHALLDIYNILDCNVFETTYEFQSTKTNSLTQITPIEFMCKTLKSHSTQNIFKKFNGISCIETIDLDQDLKTLINESQMIFQDFIALNP